VGNYVIANPALVGNFMIADILDCYKQYRLALDVAEGVPGAEQALHRQLKSTWLDLTSAASELCDLRAKRPPRQPNAAELKAAEQRTGVPPRVFLAMFGEDPLGKWDTARRHLEITKNKLAADTPSVLRELVNIDVGPALFRIGCATVAGALIGAPLGALAIHENILIKMTEAAATTAVSAFAAEIYIPLSTRLERDRTPAEPFTPLGASDVGSVVDLILHQNDEPGSMPGPGELPSEPPWSPEPPDREPPSGPKGPGGR
jgi:hypothetical protein